MSSRRSGSVFVARHSKLVYEGYFDGDATTLRDTRSATKSITSILIGLTIQENKLSGVDAGILDLLPEHRRKLENPDPRKDNIKVEDFLTMSSPPLCCLSGTRYVTPPIITGVMLRHSVCDDTLTDDPISLVMRKSSFISKYQSVSTPGTTGCVFRPGEAGR